MKHYLTLASFAFTCILLTCPLGAEAKGRLAKPEKGAQVVPVRINAKLPLIPGAPAELAKANGKLKYKLNKAGAHLIVDVKVPSNSPSLGITDVASAKNAIFTLSVLREGVSVGECTMELLIDEDEVTLPTKFHFRVNGHSNTKSMRVRFAHGSCLNGIPVIQKTDQLSVSSTVAGVAVPLF